MRTGEVAARLDVSEQTVRNYAERFSGYLSPAANPEQGAIREFTEHDVRVLLTVKRESDRRISVDEIKATLDAGRLVEEIPEVPEVEESVPAAEHALALQRINVLQRELAQTRSQHEREVDRITAELEQVKKERDEARLAKEESSERIADLNYKLGLLQGQLNQMNERMEELREQAKRSRGLFGRG